MTATTQHTGATPSVPGHVDHLSEGSDAPPPSRAPGHPLRWVWHFLTSMRTGVVLILFLGVLTLLGTLLVQAPVEIRSDPDSLAQWVEAVPRVKYGGWAPILSALGLFGVFSTWYFQGLFALLALSILACSINRAPRLWRAATRPHLQMNDAFYERAGLRAEVTVPGGVEDAASAVRAAFRAERFRVLDAPTARGADLYADKFRWGPLGTVLAHLSFVVILAGFVVSATMGFKDPDVVAPVGVPVEVGHDTGLTVTAQSFNASYYPDGTPQDYVSDLVVTRGGVQVARQETRVNRPLIYDGVWFHQSFFGIGADLTATQGGKPLIQQTVPLDRTSDDGTRVYGWAEAPSAGLTVFVSQAASGQQVADLPAGSVGLEVHRDGVTTASTVVLSPGKPATLDGVEYRFDRTREYTGLSVNRDPGSPLVWVGSILLILGSYLVFFLPHRRVWVRVRPGGRGTSTVALASSNKRDPAFEPRFDALVARLSAPRP